MSKQSGLAQGFVLNGVDLSGDTGSASAISSPRPTTPVTGIDKSAQERLQLLRDGQLDWSSWFNPTGAHPELSALPTTDRIGSWLAGRAVGDAAANIVFKQLNYDGTRNNDGSFSFALQGRANGYGLEWGDLLTSGFQTFGGAGNGTSIDTLVAASFGLQAYAHLTAFTGTSVTLSIHDSADNSAFALVTGASFSAMTGVGAQRIETARNQTVRRYLRLNLAGTFTSATVVVAVVKNDHTVEF